MPWFKIDDGFHCHPKALAAGNAALGLWTRLGAYASDQLTDGFIPAAIAKGYGTRAELTRLIDVRLLEQGNHDEYGTGYWLHDYHDYNPTADKVRADRADAAERQRKSRERRDQQHRESHDTSHSDGPPRRGVTHTTPTRPDPTRPATSRSTTTTTSTAAPVNGSSVVVDEQFDQAVELVVDDIEAGSNVQKPRAWRKSTRANVVDELGPAIRLALSLGRTPEQAAREVTQP